MSQSLAATPPRANWLIPAGRILLSLVPAIAGTHRLVELASGANLARAAA